MVKLAVVAHERKLRGKQRHALQKALAEAGLADAPWRGVSKAKKTEKAARKAVAEGAEVVLVCGGDGTVRAGAAGLVDTDAALAVLPAGTANLFATALKLPKDPTAVLATITAGARTVIDTAVCNDQTFTVMAGTGFDAAMVDDADAAKERLGFAAYLRAAVANARQGEPVRMTVTVDGNTFYEGEASCVLVGNLGTLKAGLSAFPEASPTDGILDVAVLTATGIRDWAGVLWKVVRGQQHLSGHAHMTKGKEIAVDMDDEQRMQLDGGAKGTTDSLRIAVRPHSLRVCVPSA